jgi:oligopeptide/dipeptide ABC transporter ATP-binding protein
VTSVLEVEDLQTAFFTRRGVVRALDGVTLRIDEGQVLGLVGESGSGKSATAASILRVLRSPGRIVGGRVRLDNVDLLALSEAAMEEVRGRQIAMIFQNPRACLDPVVPVGRQLVTVLEQRRGLAGRAAREAAHELLARVRLPDPARLTRAYPHELSGGMCQRVMVALALACRPRLLLADEPTTGLDVTIQHELIGLLRELAEGTGMAQLLISHDMGVVAEACDAVAVMYAGHVVERAPVVQLFDAPHHPYTIGLLACRPRIDGATPFRAIPGAIPDLRTRPLGCPFAPRCHRAADVCRQARPPGVAVGEGHVVACYFPGPEP